MVRADTTIMVSLSDLFVKSKDPDVLSDKCIGIFSLNILPIKLSILVYFFNSVLTRIKKYSII